MESRALGLGLVKVEKHDVCRLCMIEHEYCLSVFLANEVYMTSLGEFIRDLLNMEVSEGDGLPGTACSRCVEKLMEFRKFKEMCIHSEKELRRRVPTGGEDLKLRCPVEGEGVAVGLMDGGGGIGCMNVEDESTVPNEACDPLAYDNLCLVRDEGVPMQLLGEVASRYQSYYVNCESGVPVVGNDLLLDPLSLKNETDTEEVHPRDPHRDCDDCPEEDTAEGESNEDAVVCSELIPFFVGDQGEVKEESEFPELVSKEGSHSNDGYEGYSSVTGGHSLLSDPIPAMGVGDHCLYTGGLTAELEKESDEYGADGQGISHNQVLNHPSCDPVHEENLQLEYCKPNSFLLDCLPERRVKQRKKNIKFYAPSKKFTQLNDSARPVRNHEREQLCHQAENTRSPTEYICNYCNTRYSKKNSLALHIKRHVDGISSASILPKKNIHPRFSQRILVKDQEHVESVIQETSKISFLQNNCGGVRPFKCNQPGKMFSTSGNLKTHSVVHTGVKAFKCNDCGKLFSTKSDISRHLVIHSAVKPFKCNTCGKMFTTRSELNRHSVVHTGVKRFKCNACGKMFNQSSHLVMHLRIHSGVKPFKCNDCGKIFSRKGQLNEHSVVHAGVKRFKCNECGKMFNQSGTLRTHSRVHSGEKPFKCNECGKMFTTSSNLNVHSVVHTGVKRFKCNECGKMFNQSGHLRTHSRIHSGEKPFKCNKCGKMFTQKITLEKHSVIHTDVKLFKCNDCGKMFTLIGHLKSHSLVHTGVKTLKCDECGKMFARSCNLRSHMRIHSVVMPFKCDVCGKQFKWRTGFNRHLLSHADCNPSK